MLLHMQLICFVAQPGVAISVHTCSHADRVQQWAGDADLRKGPSDPEPGAPLPETKALGRFLMSRSVQGQLATWVHLMVQVWLLAPFFDLKCCCLVP